MDDLVCRRCGRAGHCAQRDSVDPDQPAGNNCRRAIGQQDGELSPPREPPAPTAGSVRWLDPALRALIARDLKAIAAQLGPFEASLVEGSVLDRADLSFDDYGEVVVVFINRRLMARGLHIDAAHPSRFLVRKNWT